MTRSLKNRLSVILAVLLAVSGLTSFLILKVAIAPAFSTLEYEEANTDLGRASLAVDSHLQQLTAIAGDWAPWDEPYAFAQGNNPDFIWRNIDLSTLRNIEIELMQFFDVEGRRLWSGYVEQDAFADIGSLGRLAENDPLYDTLTSHDDPYSVVSGLLMTHHGPMLLVSLPLVEEAGKGPIAGTIVLGRVLTEERLQKLSDRIKVPFQIVPMEEAATDMPSLLRRLESGSSDGSVHTIDETDIRSYRLLTDISGTPLGILLSHTPRDVTTLGQNAANLAFLLFVITSLLLVGSIWLLMRIDIVGPLERLAAHMAGMRRSGDLSVRIAPERGDEIGRLGHEFNALTGELQQVRRELVEQSFKAGKADTAADVLHNIRNAMTPVVNIAEGLSGIVDDMTSLRLKQAADQLADPACPPERRERLLLYISAAADRLREAGSEVSEDIGLICGQVRLVDEILAGQERVSRAEPVQERVNLGDVVSEAAGVLKKGGAEIDLRLAPELDRLTVIANRVQLLQVIGNVVLNACEAGERKGGGSVLIEIFAEQEADVVRFCVRDNGAGLSREQLTRVFQRGFTTKQGSGSGIGLHWCANAVGSIGGSMRIDSDGPGLGATVRMELPAAPSAQESSAAGRPHTASAPKTAFG